MIPTFPYCYVWLHGMLRAAYSAERETLATIFAAIFSVTRLAVRQQDTRQARWESSGCVVSAEPGGKGVAVAGYAPSCRMTYRGGMN